MVAKKDHAFSIRQNGTVTTAQNREEIFRKIPITRP